MAADSGIGLGRSIGVIHNRRVTLNPMCTLVELVVDNLRTTRRVIRRCRWTTCG